MKIATVLARKGNAFDCIAESATLAEAARLMHARTIGSIGVMGAGAASIVGIVSQHELTRAIAVHGAGALDRPVSTVMRRPALDCSNEDHAEDLMRTMTRERTRHAVVRTAAGKVAGIVSLGDLVAAMLDEARLEAGVLRDMARSQILAASR